MKLGSNLVVGMRACPALPCPGLQAGKYAESIAEYTRAISELPDMAVYYNNRALAALKLLRCGRMRPGVRVCGGGGGCTTALQRCMRLQVCQGVLRPREHLLSTR